MASCCNSPDPARVRVEQHGRAFVVMSDCRACGAARRETPYTDDESTAETMRAACVLMHERARVGWRTTPPTTGDHA